MTIDVVKSLLRERQEFDRDGEKESIGDTCSQIYLLHLKQNRSRKKKPNINMTLNHLKLIHQLVLFRNDHLLALIKKCEIRYIIVMYHSKNYIYN